LKCKVQSADYAVAICQVLSAELPTHADVSLLVKYDAHLDASEGRVAFIFSDKQSCLTVPNVYVTCCVLARNVALMLCDFKCLLGYCTKEL
jgi:hypothetical protein